MMLNWKDCGEDIKGRAIGSAVRGSCDYPGCFQEIDRGVTHACGGMHGNLDGGCHGYFCKKHLYKVHDPFKFHYVPMLCRDCKNQHNNKLVNIFMEERENGISLS